MGSSHHHDSPDSTWVYKKMRDLLTQNSWRLLLKLFQANTGQQYLEKHQALVLFFSKRGARDPIHLADLTMDRVARLLAEGRQVHDPNFVFGVAKKILLEQPKLVFVGLEQIEETVVSNLPDPEPDYSKLVNCLDKLTPPEREILLGYYQENQKSSRKVLATKFNIAPKTLRNKAYLLRLQLAECINRDTF